MGITYKYISSAFSDGVIQVKNIEEIRITDKERTFIKKLVFFLKAIIRELS